MPPRRDRDGWRALAAVLDAGLRFHATCACCNDGPGHRPRTMREVRECLEVADRTGLPLAKVLTMPEPTDAYDEQHARGGGCAP
ncbi:hypothetical protein ACQEU8_21640 [Streptomyces sp. CA-250714]|uniref:hypothetical protein n=1 Tax=Streptomyces sp. CA-250714 TaxID=3240060 RepID=UPI003D94178C